MDLAKASNTSPAVVYESADSGSQFEWMDYSEPESQNVRLWREDRQRKHRSFTLTVVATAFQQYHRKLSALKGIVTDHRLWEAYPQHKHTTYTLDKVSTTDATLLKSRAIFSITVFSIVALLKYRHSISQFPLIKNTVTLNGPLSFFGRRPFILVDET